MVPQVPAVRALLRPRAEGTQGTAVVAAVALLVVGAAHAEQEEPQPPNPQQPTESMHKKKRRIDSCDFELMSAAIGHVVYVHQCCGLQAGYGLRGDDGSPPCPLIE